MDNRRKIERLLRVSYTLHSGRNAIVSNDRDYETFLHLSKVGRRDSKNAIDSEGIASLYCAYLNCVITSANRAPLYGGKWDLSYNFCAAFNSMTPSPEDQVLKYLDEDTDHRIYLQYEPPECTGWGLPVIPAIPEHEGAGPREPGIVFQKQGNAIRICIQQEIPGVILNFADIRGSFTVRSSELAMREVPIAEPAGENQDGFPSLNSMFQLVRSSRIDSLEYTRQGGVAEPLAEGVSMNLNGGNLASSAAVTGCYVLEFAGLSGHSRHLHKAAIPCFSSYLGKLERITLHDNLAPYYLAFLRVFDADRGNLAPLIDHLSEEQIRSLAVVNSLCSVQL